MPRDVPSSPAWRSPESDVESDVKSDVMALAQPIVYLFPPSCLSRVTVQLSLSPSWCFFTQSKATINPVEYQPGQFLSWIVSAEPDGTLVNKRSRRKGTHLYWQAV
jgi:hypothetical protein